MKKINKWKKKWSCLCTVWSSLVVLVVKYPPASAGDTREEGSIPGLGRSLGGGQGNTLQCSCLENPMDRGAWWATVHRVTKSWTRLKQFSTHTVMCIRTHWMCACMLHALSWPSLCNLRYIPGLVWDPVQRHFLSFSELCSPPYTEDWYSLVHDTSYTLLPNASFIFFISGGCLTCRDFYVM